MIRFNNYTRGVGRIEKTNAVIEDEPMLFGASWDFARKNGGPLTTRVMNLLKGEANFLPLLTDQALKGYHPVIDTKTVLLQPGQYPCIGGWHCDGVIRRAVGEQPDLSTLNEDVRHFICTVSDASSYDDHCGTELLTKPLVMPEHHITSALIDGKNVWGAVNNAVEGRFADNSEVSDVAIEPTTSTGDGFVTRTHHRPKDCLYKMRDCEVFEIKRDTLHRGTAAKVRQWRWFFRLSFYHMPVANKIRKQVQVYTDISQGW